MSADDPLDDAFAAVRAEMHGRSPDARATRGRVLLAATMRARKRTRALRWIVPLAAVLAASTAWAAASGRLARVATWLGGGDAARPLPTVAAPPPPSASASAIVMPPPAGSGEDVEEETAPAPPASTTPVVSSAPRLARADDEDALFRAAHEAHFGARDPARSLAAWDRYLAAHPNGRFSPEARYNRALVLVRLGRRDEAREALRPFADGRFGDYRKKEARALLDSLD